jgi:hypothetical protein
LIFNLIARGFARKNRIEAEKSVQIRSFRANPRAIPNKKPRKTAGLSYSNWLRSYL